LLSGVFLCDDKYHFPDKTLDYLIGYCQVKKYNIKKSFEISFGFSPQHFQFISSIHFIISFRKLRFNNSIFRDSKEFQTKIRNKL